MRLSLARVLLLFVPVLAAVEPCPAQDADALAREGTAAINAGRFGDALNAFTTAELTHPDDAALCFGAGIAAFMLGRDAVAQSHFEHALALDPAFAAAGEWLGDLHYHAGRLAQAIAVYEAVLQRAPRHRELQQRLDRVRRQQALQQRFHETWGEHFTILFDTTANEQLVRTVMERLDVAYTRIGDTLGIYPQATVTVILYSREEFNEVTKLAPWSVAAYDGRISLPIGPALQEPGELDRVLSHEFVHALVATIGGRTVPAWLSEGLATVLEPTGSDGAERTLARAATRPALSQLHASFAGLSRSDAEVAYASATRAVRRLIEQRGAAPLVAVLQDLARGVPFESSFERRLALRYETFAATAASLATDRD